MKILVINTGSSSLKYDLFDMIDETILFAGQIHNIGLSDSRHALRDRLGNKKIEYLETVGHAGALDEMLRVLLNGPIRSLDEIAGVAHRVGHGGKHTQPCMVTPEVMSELRRMVPFIPLHLPAMIRGIELCVALMPQAIHVAVNDAWFHCTIPDEAAVYGLPYRYFAEKGYRRTGYHGFSHFYVSTKAAEFLGLPLTKLRIISCHLGNGASICAIKSGRSIDTTMGMSALEGLIMGTRSGDVDVGLIPVLMAEESLSPAQMIEMLYKESGLLGLSSVSSNMQEVERASTEGNKQAELAFNAFCYRVKRYIGSMLMVLGGCDVLIFTGGIGENSAAVRSRTLEGTADLGFAIDETRNLTCKLYPGQEVADISSAASIIRVLVISTFEELIMARQCQDVINFGNRYKCV
ncbi:MAG: acetate/propionate family kinase [Desulfomonile sp.]|nr:acetate/propionate family kinase [Deltaproteobacteria bacterium]